NYEPRYIWYTLPLSMIFGTLAIQHFRAGLPVRLQRLVVFIFSVSYLIVPLRDMQGMYLDGKDAYDIALEFQHRGIQGSFATNVNSGADVHFVERIAYHSGNTYYNMPVPAVQPLLLKDMRR